MNRQDRYREPAVQSKMSASILIGEIGSEENVR